MGVYTWQELRDDVLGMLDALGIEKTHFAGLSMGGMIAQHLALAAPQRLSKLVLVDTTSRYPADAAGVWQERVAMVRENGMGVLVEGTLSRWFTAPYRAAHPEVMARIGALIRNTPPAGYIGCGNAIPAINVTDRLGDVKCPTLVIVGAEDAGTPPAMAQEIADAIRGARLEIIPEAAHLSNIEQPEIFYRLVLDFLSGG